MIVAYIADELSIARILDHLGLSPLPQENATRPSATVIGHGTRPGRGGRDRGRGAPGGEGGGPCFGAGSCHDPGARGRDR
jgi:hypothetical protein